MLFISMAIMLVVSLVAFLALRHWVKKAGKANTGRPHTFDSDTIRYTSVFSWVVLVCAGLFAFMTVRSFFTVIPTGHVGVQTVFGKIQDRVLTEGLSTKNPLADVHKLTARTQSYTMSIRQGEGQADDPDAVRVLSKDNLEMDMDLTVLYSLFTPDAQRMFKVLGSTEAYTDGVVRPNIRRAIRDVASRYTAGDLMSSARGDAEKAIFNELQRTLAEYFGKKEIDKGINCEAVLLRNVQPPATLKAAIEDKLSKQQQKEGMEFVLDTERKKAEQKVIEAKGLAESQQIIDKTLTPEYLQWKYIETLKELVNSPNNTILVLPFDSKLTPLINVNK
jgi:regulator of protease activity HflC (stomatin/prohibitin superfamily)